MPKIVVVGKKQMYRIASIAVLIVTALCVAVFSHNNPALPANGAPQAQAYTIHMVTGEFESETPEGEEIEAYRWDPGTVVVPEGELVKLSIYGVNGGSHPFVIEGLNVKGEVRQGQETVVTFTASKKGVYRLICLAHTDIAHNGPMIGYIVVI